MEITKALIIVAINVAAFAVGLLLGRTVQKCRNIFKATGRHSLYKNADWQTLVNYYPGEPTEKLSSHKKYKGEKLWKKTTK